MFTNTQGKGFSMRFANGFGLSVQWGPGNYCSNRDSDFRSWTDAKCGESLIKSASAEVAILCPDGSLAYRADWQDSVKGYLTVDAVLALMNEVAAYPTNKTFPRPSWEDESEDA
jgi:hypothetical protein